MAAEKPEIDSKNKEASRIIVKTIRRTMVGTIILFSLI